MTSEQRGGTRNTPNFRTSGIDFAYKEGEVGSKKAKILWMSYMEAPSQ